MLANRKMNIVVLERALQKKRRSKSVCYTSFVICCKSTTYLTSSNIKYIDNQLVTVIKIQMICKCKYKTI